MELSVLGGYKSLVNLNLYQHPNLHHESLVRSNIGSFLALLTCLRKVRASLNLTRADLEAGSIICLIVPGSYLGVPWLLNTYTLLYLPQNILVWNKHCGAASV